MHQRVLGGVREACWKTGAGIQAREVLLLGEEEGREQKGVLEEGILWLKTASLGT